MPVKLVSATKVPYAQVFQDNLFMFTGPIEEFGKLPGNAVNPIMCIYFYVLDVTVELEDGTRVETSSDPIEISERHFWGGEEIDADPNEFDEIEGRFQSFLGRDWKEDLSLRLLRFELYCGSCSEPHEYLLPMTLDDIIHSQGEWDDI
jgi:hypothetical protein